MLLPKCPLCIAAWLGILGSLGANSWLSAVWGTPLAVGLLSFAVGAMALRARRSRDPRQLLVGTLGAATLLVGKCVIDAPVLLYGGFALLMGASFWSSWSLFSENHSVLRRWEVSSSELRFLKRLNQLGVVTRPKCYLFVLNSVRQAIAPRE